VVSRAPSTDRAVLVELGRRLARTRLEQNLTQEELAFEAGISKPSVERLEAGVPVKLETFLRVLRALGLLETLDRLVPVPLPSPIERLRHRGHERRRATGGRTGPERAPRDWTWGDPRA
jgi:transcriptional regulator with XRE-family HTH domain